MTGGNTNLSGGFELRPARLPDGRGTSVSSKQDEARLRDIAEHCETIATACFDLAAAERLRALAGEIKAVADNLTFARGVRRNKAPPD
jgi:hypothetical protein